MTAAELDIVVKLVIGIIGAGSGIVTWFAKRSFEEMKGSLDDLVKAVNESRISMAVLETKAIDQERRMTALELRVGALEADSRQMREG